MEKQYKKRKIHFGKTIRRLMAQENIITVKELTDKINEIAGEKYITANSVGKWFRPRDEGGTEPKGTSLMFLAKALKADFLIFDESGDSQDRQVLKEIVAELVQKERENLLKEAKSDIETELGLVLKSDKIPQEDKDALIRQARNLLKLYKEIE